LRRSIALGLGLLAWPARTKAKRALAFRSVTFRGCPTKFHI
jgi:hypothetical protein